jgi:DNA sulfur modification protein DndD
MTKVTFKGIGVQNLGPFRERQYLDLQVRPNRPIILVKALNGSGKTTLLTCLQVVLYGIRALGVARTAEYEQLIRGLQRKDAQAPAQIDLDIEVESAGERDAFTVSRQWCPTPTKLNERLTVSRGGSLDFELSTQWQDYIDGILPSELLQLFLFDGEKIEALANPKSLPDMLRRATEAFLGIGGIDAVTKDLSAVERRSLLHAKAAASDYGVAREELETLEKQRNQVQEVIDVLVQRRPAAADLVEQARDAYGRTQAQGQREGVTLFEQAAQIRASYQLAQRQNDDAAMAAREALANPLLPLASTGDLWRAYVQLWDEERQGKAATELLREIERRDERVLLSLGRSGIPDETISVVENVLSSETARYRVLGKRAVVLVDAPEPAGLQAQIEAAQKSYEEALIRLHSAKTELRAREERVAAIPSEHQLASLLQELQIRAAALSTSEAALAALEEQLSHEEARRAHLEMRLVAARDRMGKDFRGQALDGKAIEAGQRARAVLGAFKEKLLAAKAVWLSNMITAELKSLMRKQRLVQRVQVEPDTYAVSIVAKDGDLLPMERLSAGERQLLAIAVLSALIRERKGRFPVVVDTPLARLDRSHRQALIQRFFAKISHQVMVLSTDEEVEGAVYDEMERFTSRSYLIEFADDEHRSSVAPLLKAA